MFDRYTDRARRALVIAQDEARNLGLLRVGAGHLLIGLIGEDGGVAAVALKSLGASMDEARYVMSRNALPVVPAPAGQLPFTSRLTGVLNRAVTEATLLGNNYIATEHLLLALISDSEGTGNDPLVAIGINPGDARAKVMELLRGYEEAGKRPLTEGTSAPTAADDTLSAALEEIRARGYRRDQNGAAAFRQSDDAARDVPRLLAALDEVLKTADEWEASSDARPLIRRGYAAEVFRAAITRGLTGKEDIR